jgi:hypothetical protein
MRRHEHALFMDGNGDRSSVHDPVAVGFDWAVAN